MTICPSWQITIASVLNPDPSSEIDVNLHQANVTFNKNQSVNLHCKSTNQFLYECNTHSPDIGLVNNEKFIACAKS